MSAQSPQDRAAFTKLSFLPDLKTFHGTPSEEIVVWLLRMKQYFKLINLDRDKWVYAASMYLEDGAAIWYYLFALPYDAANSISWDNFESAIKMRYRFGPFESSLLPSFGQKTSCESVRDYLEQWERYRVRRPNDDLSKLLLPFSSRLPSHTRDQLIANAPQTFMEMINRTVLSEFSDTRSFPELNLFFDTEPTCTPS
ncbi:uncharacterized protein UTRI_05627 [Ustilago trichophora]|uniref:Retrotransposon gag domain-containing protein n=1 Tax=Ustilago trichophora TaxID=86804 RepID=A0A5C3EEI9_9BASI|nr:uncharacterized protein UTRI_05627 [Ustilago trichophora]